MMRSMLHRIAEIVIAVAISISLFSPQQARGVAAGDSLQLRNDVQKNSGKGGKRASTPFSPMGHYETSFVPAGEIILANPDLVFAYGPGNSYVYQSKDRGRLWHTLSDGIYWASKRAFAISPDFEGDHTLFLGLNYGNDAFLISTDGGDHWHLPQDQIIGPVLDIAVSPGFSADRTLFISTQDYLNVHFHRSTDGGDHWQPLAMPDVSAVTKIIVSPNYGSDHTLFVRLSYYSFWRSTDGGDNCDRADNGLFLGSDNKLFDLAVAQTEDDLILFAAVESGLAVSFNQGQNWYFITDKSFTRIAASKNEITGYLDLYGIDAGNFDLIKSTDGGETWVVLLGRNPVSQLALSPEYDHDQTVYARNESSMWASADGRQSWALSTTTPDINLSFNDRLNIAPSPNFETDKTVFAYQSIKSNSILESTDGGKSWSIVQLPGSGEMALAFSPDYASDHTIFIAYGRLLITSSNDGEDWDLINDSLPFDVEILRISPGYSVDQTLFIARYGSGLSHSTNGGISWEPLSGTEPYLYDLEVSPAFLTDHTVFVSGSYISRSEDGGATWDVFYPLPSGGGYVMELSPAYPSDHTLYAGVSGYSDGGLARSTDRGDHWEDITFDEISWYMADIALSPHYAQDQTVIVAADSKPPYISEDGGATWFPLQGIPPVGGYGAKYDLAITYEDGLLCPLATTPSSFFRYGWPQLNTPNPIRIGLQMDITDTVHTIIPLSATEPGEAPWQLQENAA